MARLILTVILLTVVFRVPGEGPATLEYIDFVALSDFPTTPVLVMPPPFGKDRQIQPIHPSRLHLINAYAQELHLDAIEAHREFTTALKNGVVKLPATNAPSTHIDSEAEMSVPLQPPLQLNRADRPNLFAEAFDPPQRVVTRIAIFSRQRRSIFTYAIREGKCLVLTAEVESYDQVRRVWCFRPNQQLFGFYQYYRASMTLTGPIVTWREDQTISMAMDMYQSNYPAFSPE